MRRRRGAVGQHLRRQGDDGAQVGGNCDGQTARAVSEHAGPVDKGSIAAGRDDDFPYFADELVGDYPAFDEGWLRAIARRHGTRARAIIGTARKQTDLGWNFGGELYGAEVDWMMAEEWAMEPDDILWRRPSASRPLADYVAQPVRIVREDPRHPVPQFLCLCAVIHGVAQQAMSGFKNGRRLRLAEIALTAMQQGAAEAVQLFGPIRGHASDQVAGSRAPSCRLPQALGGNRDDGATNPAAIRPWERRRLAGLPRISFCRFDLDICRKPQLNEQSCLRQVGIRLGSVDRTIRRFKSANNVRHLAAAVGGSR